MTFCPSLFFCSLSATFLLTTTLSAGRLICEAGTRWRARKSHFRAPAERPRLPDSPMPILPIPTGRKLVIPNKTKFLPVGNSFVPAPFMEGLLRGHRMENSLGVEMRSGGRYQVSGIRCQMAGRRRRKANWSYESGTLSKTWS